MTIDPVDDALAREPAIEPDRTFTATVMAAVHRDAATPPLRFPWRRFVAGLAATIAVPLAAGLLGVPAPTPDAAAPFAWMAVALTGTWLCYAAAMRLARAAN